MWKLRTDTQQLQVLHLFLQLIQYILITHSKEINAQAPINIYFQIKYIWLLASFSLFILIPLMIFMLIVVNSQHHTASVSIRNKEQTNAKCIFTHTINDMQCHIVLQTEQYKMRNIYGQHICCAWLFRRTCQNVVSKQLTLDP